MQQTAASMQCPEDDWPAAHQNVSHLNYYPRRSSAMRKVIAIISIFSAASACNAAPPTADSIDALLVATKSESLIESMYANMEQMMRQGMAQAVSGKNVSAEQQRVLDAAPKQFAAVMREELSCFMLKPMFTEIYQESFSQEEIDGLIAFYASPAGRAYIDKMPLVMQKTMTVMQSRMPAMIERIRAAREKALADAKLAK